jgi:hypothetical protein
MASASRGKSRLDEAYADALEAQEAERAARVADITDALKAQVDKAPELIYQKERNWLKARVAGIANWAVEQDDPDAAVQHAFGDLFNRVVADLRQADPEYGTKVAQRRAQIQKDAENEAAMRAELAKLQQQAATASSSSKPKPKSEWEDDDDPDPFANRSASPYADLVDARADDLHGISEEAFEQVLGTLSDAEAAAVVVKAVAGADKLSTAELYALVSKYKMAGRKDDLVLEKQGDKPLVSMQMNPAAASLRGNKIRQAGSYADEIRATGRMGTAGISSVDQAMLVRSGDQAVVAARLKALGREQDLSHLRAQRVLQKLEHARNPSSAMADATLMLGSQLGFWTQQDYYRSLPMKDPGATTATAPDATGDAAERGRAAIKRLAKSAYKEFITKAFQNPDRVRANPEAVRFLGALLDFLDNDEDDPDTSALARAGAGILRSPERKEDDDDLLLAAQRDDDDEEAEEEDDDEEAEEEEQEEEDDRDRDMDIRPSDDRYKEEEESDQERDVVVNDAEEEDNGSKKRSSKVLNRSRATKPSGPSRETGQNVKRQKAAAETHSTRTKVQRDSSSRGRGGKGGRGRGGRGRGGRGRGSRGRA